jgi:hypothetical protein
MVMVSGSDPERSRLGWQGDAVDVEVQRFNDRHRICFRWTIYYRARRIKTGVRRTNWGASLAGQLAARWYRFTQL